MMTLLLLSIVTDVDKRCWTAVASSVKPYGSYVRKASAVFDGSTGNLNVLFVSGYEKFAWIQVSFGSEVQVNLTSKKFD